MKTSYLLMYTCLLLIGLLAGNAFTFVIGMGTAMEKLSASSYIVFHHSMQRTFLTWTPVLSAIAVVLLSFLLMVLRKKWNNFEFLLIFFSLICIADELFMTFSGNMPLSRMIHSWQVQGTPDNWGDIRNQWVHLMYWRCALLTSSFAMLSASIFIMNSEIRISQDVAVAA